MDKESQAQTYEGVITITRKGTGFFTYDEEKEDFIIPKESLNHALNHDVVTVAPDGFETDARTGEKRAAAKVVRVVARARETFVGTLMDDKGPLLIPDLKKMYVPLDIRGELPCPLGYKVLVRMKGWDEGSDFPWGVVEQVIGPAGVHETEMRALALGQGFEAAFPPAVVKAAEVLQHEGHAMIAEEAARAVASGERRDFRDVPTCTIDPADAKDFDDALSFKDKGDGTFEVGIHIADVSFFVKQGGELDKEAYQRATSVYLVDRTIPMLPEVLSNDLCSLRQGEDRLAVSAVFTLDANAKVLDRWFGETVIHSDRRYTYEDAQKTLEAGAGDLHAELSTLRTLAKLLRKKRQANGAIEFDTAEVKIELDDAGKPVAVHLKERKDTNLLIEDFMLLANESVAEHLADLSKNLRHGYLYRIHDAPDADRIENLSLFLRVLGYDLETHAGNVKGVAINELLEKVKGKPEEYLIKTATLRSMAKAVYSTKNIGHYGLAFTHYTHFTSPIRRYPDLVVHRLLKHHAGREPMSDREVEGFEQLAIHCSEREVAATEAERDSIKMKQVEYLAGRVGDAFDAVISGVSDRGMYVEEQTTHADGMIRIRDLGDDYFDYDEKGYRLVGRRTKKQYRIGDPIRVTLAAARVPEKELDFVPASE
ncbi:MAG: ribonuclease R [Patescibacteria group bacterium]|nr:ribonuclease R [Patescibacteria group bacterium]MDE1966076.1 ribonuclease R [Patescibacteria group bacterium]